MHIIIADDHELIREGLRDTMQALFAQSELHLAHNASTAIAMVASVADVGLLLTDLFMPDMDGFAYLRALCNAYPELPVVVLSASESPAHIHKALDIGISGYIPKSFSRDDLAAALRLVMAGGIFVPEQVPEQPYGASDVQHMVLPTQDSIAHTLTLRQQDILKALAAGKSNKLIARELHLSENTIKVHVSAILKLLNLKNRSQAGILAEKVGLL